MKVPAVNLPDPIQLILTLRTLQKIIKMIITNSTHQDIDEIFRLYALATAYQKEKFPGNQWPLFDRKLIETEISENRQFKILIDNKIVCIWAITFSDPEIWEEKNKDPAIYIHRIATNPLYRKRNFIAVILEWAKTYAELKNKNFIRMDTCGDNKKLISHYCKNGFTFLEMKKLQSYEGLPEHYQNAEVCFFEIAL